MPRRAVLAPVVLAVLLGAAAAPALANGPTVVCVITQDDPASGSRQGVCAWAPVPHPLPIPPLPR